jgi:peroxin-4
MSTTSQSSSRNAARRLIKELETWHNVESKDEKGIERLGPVNEGELLAWEAVINGRGVGAGYDGSFFSLRTTLSQTVNVEPPKLTG